MTDIQPNSRAVLGPVQLRLPPDPAMSRVLRLASSGLASLSDFTVDEVEDVKIAVSEMLIVLVEHGAGHPIDVVIDTDRHSLRIQASTAVERFDPDHPDFALCRTVLGSVCLSHDIAIDGDQARIHAVLLRGG